jgi:hypothetical protein
MYLTQLLTASSLLLVIFWRSDRYFRVQIASWALLNVLIYIQHGELDQLDFYSNDQRHFYNVTGMLVAREANADIDWWFSSARIPFTLPAALLGSAGFHLVIALKIVSLLFLLGTTYLIRVALRGQSHSLTAMSIYLTTVGPVGIFFSTLAQRETSMMFFTTLAFTSRSQPVKLLSLLLLLHLRPHLAIAVAVGWFFLLIINGSRRLNSSKTPVQSVTMILAGSIIGYLLFAIGTQVQSGMIGVFGHQFGIVPAIRIASNFFGLQFLAAKETSIQLSISELLFSRLLFSETIVLPSAFTVIFLMSRKSYLLANWVLLSFAIYVGLVTNTDFNSFRQNVPLMPVMGFCVVNALQRWRALRISDDKARTLVETSD